jgi:hypothetical protein
MSAAGTFICYELMTGDAAAAAQFYGPVVVALDPQGVVFGSTGPLGGHA